MTREIKRAQTREIKMPLVTIQVVGGTDELMAEICEAVEKARRRIRYRHGGDGFSYHIQSIESVTHSISS